MMRMQQFKYNKAKLMHWALLIQEFDFKIKHCPGKNNELPNALSCHPVEKVTQDDDMNDSRMLPPVEGKLYTVERDTVSQYILAAQAKDPLMQEKLGKLRDLHGDKKGPNKTECPVKTMATHVTMEYNGSGLDGPEHHDRKYTYPGGPGNIHQVGGSVPHK